MLELLLRLDGIGVGNQVCLDFTVSFPVEVRASDFCHSYREIHEYFSTYINAG